MFHLRTSESELTCSKWESNAGRSFGLIYFRFNIFGNIYVSIDIETATGKSVSVCIYKYVYMHIVSKMSFAILHKLLASIFTFY
jgi:hypothetical protein